MADTFGFNPYSFNPTIPYPTQLGQGNTEMPNMTPQQAMLMNEAQQRQRGALSMGRQAMIDNALQAQQEIERNAVVPQNQLDPSSYYSASPPTYQRNPNLNPALRRLQEIEAGAKVEQDALTPTGETAPASNTGNARGSRYPNQNIGTNEMLMRIGSAMMGGASQGGLNAYNQAINEYGRIQDYNREGERLAYEDETARLKALGKNQQKQTDPNAGFIVNDDVDIALEILGEDADGFLSNLANLDLPAAGGIGNLLKNSPWSSDAKALRSRLDSIRANIGFDKLQNMREMSPTGGALGQVSEKELYFLQSTFGSLDQSISAKDLYYNLARLQYYYNNVIHGKGNHKYTMPSRSDFDNLRKDKTKLPVGMFTPTQQKLLEKYSDAIADTNA